MQKFSDALEHVMAQLSSVKRNNKQIKHISKTEYETFCKEFVFDQLRGDNFGAAFCKRFDITDFVLNILQSRESAMKHIKTVGYIRDTNTND